MKVRPLFALSVVLWFLLTCEGGGGIIVKPNQLPVILFGPSASATIVPSGGETNLSVSADDLDGDVLSYQWTQINPANPQGIFSSRFSRVTNWTAPTVTTPINFTLQVSVADGKGGVVNATIAILVQPPGVSNRNPIITSGPSASPPALDEGKSTILSVEASDPDGDNLLFEWKKTSPVPEEVVGRQKMIQWTAPEMNADTNFTFSVSITDGRGGVANGAVNVMVRNVNKPPTISEVTAQPSETVEGGTIQLNVNATDPENQPLSYLWRQISPIIPPGTFLPDNQQKQVLWTAPTVTQDTVFQLGVQVRDAGGVTASASVLVTVRNTNQPPQILPPGASANPHTISDGELTQLSISAFDPDGSEIFYQWNQESPAQPVGGFSNAQGNATSWRAPEVPADTVFILKATVRDAQGATVFSTVAVNVLTETDSPFFTSVIQASRTEVPETESVSLSIQAVDPDGDPLSFEWSQVAPSAPVGSFSNITAPNTEWTAPEVLGNTVFTLKTSVTDGLYTIERSINIQVLGDNDPPRILFGPNANPPSIWEKTSTQLSVQTEDPEGYPLTYLWQQVEPTTPVGPFSAPTSPETIWTAPNFVENTQVRIQVSIQDPQGGVTIGEVLVQVNAINDVPVITSAVASPSTITDARPNNLTLLTVNAFDPEGETLIYLWTQFSPAFPEGYFESPTQSQTQWQSPILGANTVFTHRITVTDAHGASAFRNVVVTVLDVNQPPNILEISAQPEELDERSCRLAPPAPDVRCTRPYLTQLDVVAEDPDGPPTELTYSWTQVKVEPVIPATGVFSNPNVSNPTWYVEEVPSTVSEDYIFTLQVTVRDARGGSDVRDIDLVIHDINKPPVVRSIRATPTPIWEKQNEENRQDWTLVMVDAYDPDEDGIDYQWFQIIPDPDDEPDLVGVFEDNMASSTRWFASDIPRPLTTRYVDFTLQVRLNDGRPMGTSTANVGVRVNQVNKSPIFVEGPTANPGAIDELTSTSLYVRVTDPDGDPITYLWQQILPPSPVGTFSPPDRPATTWEAPDVRVWTTFDHRITVWDNPPPGYPQRSRSRQITVRVFNVYIWERFQTLASDGRQGQSCFVDTTSLNYPYIVYYTKRHDGYRLTYFDGINWNTEDVTTLGGDIDGEVENLTEIQIDADDSAHISYYVPGGGLEYRKRNSDGSWDPAQRLHGGTGVGKYNSIGLDANGKVHIGYWASARLYYATNQSGFWQIANADPQSQSGQFASIAFKNDIPAISHWWYKDGEFAELKMVVRGATPFTWSRYIIDMVDIQDRIANKWNEGKDTSLAVKPSTGRYVLASYDMDDGDLDVIVFTNPPAGDISPCTFPPDVFGCETDSGRWNDIDLDLREDMHIVFYDFDLKDLKWLFLEEGTGRYFTMDLDDNLIGPDEGLDLGFNGSSIALDSHNNLHICTFDKTNEDLLYVVAWADRSDDWIP